LVYKSAAFVTVREVAALLRVSITTTIYKRCGERMLPHVRVSNALRIHRDAVVELIRVTGKMSSAPDSVRPPRPISVCTQELRYWLCLRVPVLSSNAGATAATRRNPSV